MEEEVTEVSMERHGHAKQLVVFFGAAGIGTGGGWGADAVLRACCKVVCRPRGAGQRRGRVVLVHEHRTTRVSSTMTGKQPCEEELNKLSATRPAGWKPPAGHAEQRLVLPAWSQRRAQPVRALMWCPVVAPGKPPQAPRSSQEATQPAASEPGPSTPPPAKLTKAKQAAEPTQPTKGKGKAKGKAALNMQRIEESRWRPLELCYWKDQAALPAKGKEYPGLGYKRLRDKPPKAQEQQPAARALALNPVYNEDYLSAHHQMQAPVQDSSTPGASGQATQGHHSKPDGSSVPILTILGMTCFMSAMAGFGALPFFFCGKLKQSWAGIANAVACGVMLSASFDLLHEGAPYSPFLTIVGMLAGAIFIKSSQEFLSQFDDASFQDLNGADARKAMLIVGVMAAHAFGEGSGVGVSFSGHRGWAQGTLVTIAIGLHNIPEGMAVATVMVAKGAPPRKALFWSLFCAFPQALVAVPSFMFVETFQALLPMALGFAAGCMIWIVCAELMPDALEAAPHPQVATAATCSAAWLQGMSMLIATLEKPDGALASPIKADLAHVSRQLLALSPALMVPCLVAAVAVTCLPSIPLTLGAAAGAMGALGGGHLLTSMLHGVAIGRVALLSWAVVGAAVVVWLQRKDVPGSSTTGSSHEVKGAHAEQLGMHIVGGRSRGASAGGTLPQPPGTDLTQGWLHRPALQSHLSGQQLIDRSSHHASSNGVLQQHLPGSGSQQPWEPALTHELNPHARLHVGNGQLLHCASHANGYATAGAAAAAAAAGSAYDMAANPQPHSYVEVQAHSMLCGCEQCKAGSLQGQGLYGSFPDHGSVVFQAGEPPLLLGGVQGSSRVGRAAWAGSLLLLGHAAGGVGGPLAAALAASSVSVTHLVWPLVHHGLPVGLVCAGLSKAAFGPGRLPSVLLAASFTACSLITAMTCVAGAPVGPAASPPADWLYDSAHHTQAVQAAVAGALLAGSTHCLWPAAAAASKARRARTGLFLGITVGAVSSLLALAAHSLVL
ncbi:hypothetical protein QJQ45_019728 [Haematococcus lacustris]|nr:hypothetical protein QJQ45_019728 [Haematococcus lacustris]